MRKRIVFGTLLMFLLISILTWPLVDAGTKTDISPTYGVYDRLAAYNYAQKYWDEVCSDGYFVNTRTTFIRLDPGTDITGMTGYDCAHFVSCCIGNESHEPGGGLDVPRKAPHIYGELGATWLGDWLITSGNGVEKTTVSELMMGDVINYDWNGDGYWDHAALYLGGSEVAGHTTCVWEADWQLVGAADYRFVHILSAPWIVDDDGPADFHTIQEAINVAGDGDTIFVRNGTYYENVIVNRSVSIIGEDKTTAIVDGSGYGAVFSVTAQNILISNFTIRNSSGSYPNSGIFLANSNTTIYNNIVRDNNIDILLRSSSGNTISKNTVTTAIAGIALDSSSNNNILCDNVINQLTGDAFRIFSSENNILYRNLIANNTAYTIYLNQANNNMLVGNTILGNSYIIIQLHTTSNNSFYYNNFLDNSGGISTYASVNDTWDNGCEGNYWSNYNGTDLNADGVGDTELPWEGVDNYPLMNPYWNPGDVNHDLKINIYDVVRITSVYGSQEGDPN
ncbi:MAG: right-handed parallel beta-helix repeat-containing protein [Candidatus Bathyarchaeota archaeon]|nr:right-handed parallel beta-helix repeat-containing protein [Candidatus Bathyarchaeota archaeon]MDH5734433.1 right-handed parallel beta-helix repeat-containing protein [Candidatus Bathyarchaeota archaeon]